MSKLIVILGPTASGKTKFATQLASKISGAIISADSRQVYRKMNIGTGKDLEDFIIQNRKIPYHLIDICNAGKKYNLALYQQDFNNALQTINNQNQQPILCGGTGLYIEAVLNNYSRTQYGNDQKLRQELDVLNREELLDRFSQLNINDKSFDTSSKKRLIRAIEILSIEENIQDNGKKLEHIIYGIEIDRESRRKKITERLHYRLQNGMIEEVEDLIKEGVSKKTLEYYGLEYKYISYYLSGQIRYDEMKTKLNTEIHRFAKRQMTWFRRMERNGFNINWIDFNLSFEEKLKVVKANQPELFQE